MSTSALSAGTSDVRARRMTSRSDGPLTGGGYRLPFLRPATGYSVAVSGQPHIEPVVPRARVANIANVLTGVRLVLVPVFLVLLFVGDGHETFWRIAAFVVFAVDVITDRFDGALARS